MFGDRGVSGLLSQWIVGIAVGIPVAIVAGLAVMLAIGGVMGCAECIMARFGSVRFIPGVVESRGGRAAPV